LSRPPPRLLTDSDDLNGFSCSDPELDDWLKKRALRNQASGATRTYVVVREGMVAGFYAIAAGAVMPSEATGRFRRNMPEVIPVVLLARLATDERFAGQGLGRAMIRHCSQRVLDASDILGARGILVHAASPAAKAFYIAVGFTPSPVNPMTLMITMPDIRAAL
jgi:GNAT superfamily N-acetyltransferase